MSPRRLAESLATAPVIKKGPYDYFVHPITDGIPRLEPELIEEVVGELARRLPPAFDLLLTAEAMGIPTATALALHVRKPLTVARKRSYGLPGEIVVPQRTGYGAATLHVHGLGPRVRVVIIDDVISTGGTLRALHTACRQAGATIEKVLVVIDKAVDLPALSRELGAPIEALVKIRIVDGRVRVEG